MMTKGGKEEKVMGPLFPRLHVNDASSKGGPRAPPRNKMALYEHFSVPSHRFTPPAAAPSPLPSCSSACNIAPSTSSTQGYTGNRNLLPSFIAPSRENVRPLEKLDVRPESSRQSQRPAVQPKSRMDFSIFAGTEPERQTNGRPAKDMDVSGSAAEGVSRRTEVIRAHAKRPAEEDDGMVPSSIQPYAGKDNLVEHEGATTSRPPVRCLDRRKDADDLRSLDSHGASKGPREVLARPAAKEKHCSSFPEPDGNFRKLQKMMEASVQEDRRSNAPVTKAMPPPEKNTEGEQEEGMSDTSMEAIPGMKISSDDVVGAIGPKHFWKVRRAIVNQQRVFAVQVFELHRLLKVQKLISSSPDLLLEADPVLGQSLTSKKPPPAAESVPKSQSQSAKNRDDVPRLKQRAECSKENTELAPCGDATADGDRHEQPATHAAAESPPPPEPVAQENKSNGWWLPQPPPSQWLVPVMSPSEGLIYKAYSGPCPPAGSFMLPFFAPLSMPSTASGYGVPQPPPPAQNLAVGPPTYFPPFGVPVVNHNQNQNHQVVSSSAVEQVTHAAAAAQLNAAAYAEQQHSWSSCNMAAWHKGGGQLHGDSELQGSTASSPFNRGGGGGSSSEQAAAAAARIIRVVPHNARSAPESAARIFRSIQKERQHKD